MTINKRWNRASREYRCEMCREKIGKGISYCRMFGMADRGDKPFAIRVCASCVDAGKTDEIPREVA